MNRFILLLALVAALLMGCAQEQQPPLRIGTNVWPGYEPLYLARELNYFDKSVVRLVEYTSSSEVMRAFQNGTIDAAGLTLDEALQLLFLGADIKVVLVMDVSHGADAILAQPGITSMQELRSKRVGYESTAVGAYVLSRALQLAHMQLGDIKTVPLEFDRHEQAFGRNEVAAVVTFEPAKSRLLANGAVKLFDSSQIPDEIVDVLVVRSKSAQDKQEYLRQILKGWFRALEQIKRNEARAAQLMAVRAAVSPEAFLEALLGLRFPDPNENSRMLSGKTPGLFVSAGRHAAVLLEGRPAYKIPPFNTLFDGSYLKEAGQ